MNHLLKYLVFGIFAFLMLSVAFYGFWLKADAQVVPAQNQIIPSAYFGDGYLISTSTSGTHKLGASLVDLAGSFITGILGVPNGGTGSTTLSGILKGNGASAVQTAVGNTDYQLPITLTTTGSSGAATFNGVTLNIPQYSGGGASPIATSSSETATYVPFWTSTNGTPALLSGGSSNFTFDSTLGKLSFLTASTSNIGANSSAGIDIHSNSGSLAANFGAGGGTNATFYGGVNIDGTTRLATSLTGALSASSGVVSAGTLSVANGGTGLGSIPAYGEILVGNDTGYTLTATSSLGLQSVLQGTHGQVAYFSGTNTAVGTSSLLIGTDGRITMGTTTGFTAPIAGTGVHAVGPDGGPQRTVLDSYNGNNNFGSLLQGRRSRGTAGAPSAVLDNDVLLTIGGSGYGATGYVGSSASQAVITLKADGTWTDVSAPSSISFFTTPSGSITAAEAVRISNNGFTGFGTTTPRAGRIQSTNGTGPQIALSDGVITTNAWTMRAISNSLYFATSSPSTFATSTVAALSFNQNGIAAFALCPTILASACTGSAGFVRATSPTIATPTITTSAVIPIVNGGTAAGSTLTLRSTSGAGVGADAIIFGVGNNGAVERGRMNLGGFGLGTTTPRWNLQIASSSAPQLALSDGSLTSNHWTFRNAGGFLYVATSSPANYATSTATALSIDLSGIVSMGKAIIVDILRIPYGATPTVATNGDLAVDSTSNQVKYQSNGATRVLGNGNLYPTFTYATSTWTGTTTIPLGTAYIGETWNGVQCFTDTGTVNVSFYDGTNRMNMFNASTTVGTVTLSTNNTFTAAEKRYVDVGTPASSPKNISCTVNKSLTAD